MRLTARGKHSSPQKFPKLVKANGSWSHYQFQSKWQTKKQVEIKLFLRQLHQSLYPVIDHIHEFALRKQKNERGIAKFSELVFVAYGYTIGIEHSNHIQNTFKKLETIVANLGFTMSQRPVQYGTMKANEIIIATHNNLSIACDLVQKFGKEGRLRADVKYGSGVVFVP